MIDASRRLFLKSAVSAAAVLPAAASAVATDAATLHLERFIYDDRFAEAVAAARTSARDGVAISGMSGDLTDLWRHELRPAWRTAPMTLGGVTTPASLFVLETLAGDHRMHVVHRRELPPAGSRMDTLVSWTIAPRPRSA